MVVDNLQPKCVLSHLSHLFGIPSSNAEAKGMSSPLRYKSELSFHFQQYACCKMGQIWLNFDLKNILES